MSASIDEKIVKMNLDNSGFEAGAKQSMATMDQLRKTFNIDNISSSLKNLDTAIGKLDMSSLNNAAEITTERFSTLGVIAMGALQRIGQQLEYLGETMVRNMTIQPLIDGFHEYEMTMNSVKTIMANQPNVGMDRVNSLLADLNKYADDTIYTFSDMTRAIGQFTAAGVDVTRATDAIKGMSNVAAGAGANNEALSRAEYQVSQALQAGVFHLMDWNSLVQAGMANPELQSQLIATADTMKGIPGYVEGIIAKEGSFRDSLNEGWLTADVWIETMKKAQDTSTEWGARLTDAATQVNTFSQLLSVLGESIGSSWTNSWQILLGDYETSKKLFTDIYNSLNTVIDGIGNSRNAMLQEFVDLGGREAIINGLSNAFHGLGDVLNALAPSFSFLTENMGQTLANGAKAFENFTAKIRDFGAEFASGKLDATAKGLQGTVNGLATILWGITQVGGQVIHFFGRLADSMLRLAGVGLQATGVFGDFLTSIRQNGSAQAVIDGISKAIDFLFDRVNDGIAILGKFTGAVVDFAKTSPIVSGVADAFGFAFKSIIGVFTNGINAISQFKADPNGLKQVNSILPAIKNGFQILGEQLANIAKFLIGADLPKLIGSIALAFAAIKFSQIVSNVENLTKTLKYVGKSFKGISQFGKGVEFAGIAMLVGSAVLALKTIVDSIAELTEIAGNANFPAAIAVVMGITAVVTAILGFFVWYASKENSVKTFGASGNMFGDILTSIFNQFTSIGQKFADAAKMSSIAAMIVSLVAAITAITAAIATIAQYPVDQIVAAGTMVGILTAEVAGIVAAMTKLVSTVNGIDIMALLATGLVFDSLSKVLKSFAIALNSVAGASPQDVAMAAASIVALLAALTGVMIAVSRFSGSAAASLKASLSVLAITTGLSQVVKAVSELAGLMENPTAAFEALAGVTLLLTALMGITLILSHFDSGMSTTSLKSAVSVLALCGALKLVVDALVKMSSFLQNDPETIVKGIVAIAAMLAALVAVDVALGKLSGTSASIKAALSVLAIAQALGMVVDALVNLADHMTDPEAMKQSMMAITTILVELTAICIALSSMDSKANLRESMGTALTVVAFAGALEMVIDAVTKLATLYSQQAHTQDALIAVGLLLAELGIIADVVGANAKISGGIGAAIEMMAFATALGGLVSAVSTMAAMFQQDSLGTVAALVSVGVMLGVLAGIMTLMSSNLASIPGALAAGVSMVAVILSLTALTNALSGISDMGAAVATAGMLTILIIALGVVLAAMAGLGASALLAIPAAASMTLVILGLAGLTLAVSTIKDVNTAVTTIGMLVVLLGAVTVAIGILSSMGASALAAIPAVVAIDLLLAGLSAALIAGSVAINQLASAVDKIADVLVKMGELDPSAIYAFKDVLATLALCDLATALAGILGGVDSLDKSVDALAKLAGVLDEWSNSDYSSAASNMEHTISSIGKALQSFDTLFNASGFAASSFETTANGLRTMAGSLDEWANVPDDLGSRMGNVLANIATNVRYMNDIGNGADALSTLAQPMGDLATSLMWWNGVTIDGSNLGYILANIATNVRYMNDIGDGANNLGTVSDGLSSLGSALQSWNDISIDGSNLGYILANIATNVRYMNDVGDGAAAMKTISESLGTLAACVQQWMNLGDLSTIGSDMGNVLANIATNVGYMNGVGDGATAMGSITNSLGELAGGVQAWMNLGDLSTIGSDMGNVLANIATNTSYFNNVGDGASAMGSISGALGSLADGVASWMNLGDLSTIGSDMGNVLANIATNVGYMNGIGDGASAMGTVASNLSTLADGVASWMNLGDLSTIGSDMGNVLANIATNVGYMNGIGDGASAMGTVADGITSIANAVNTWISYSIDSSVGSDIGYVLANIATNVGYLAGLDMSQISSAASGINDLTGALAYWISSGVTSQLGSDIGYVLANIATNVGYFSGLDVSVIGSIGAGLSFLASGCYSMSSVDVGSVAGSLYMLSGAILSFAGTSGASLGTTAGDLYALAAACGMFSGAANAAITAAISAGSAFMTMGMNASMAANQVQGAFASMLSIVSTNGAQMASQAMMYGTQTGSNFANGIRSATGAVSSAAWQLVNTATATLQGASVGAARAAGAYFAQGYASGIASGTGAVAAAARNIANAAMAAVNSAQQTGSPAKKLIIAGRWFGAGYAVGIKDNEQLVRDNATSLAQTAIAAMNSANEVSASPTIRPVIDGVSVQNGIAGLNSVALGLDSDFTYSAKTSNADVVSAISDLRHDINNYTDELANSRMATINIDKEALNTHPNVEADVLNILDELSTLGAMNRG